MDNSLLKTPQNNDLETISPKELKMQVAGLTREKAYKKIVDMHDAQIMTLDKFGGEHFAADNSTQLRAAEMLLKMTGDIKPEGSTTITTNNISITAEEFERIVAQYGAPKILRQSGEIIDVRSE